MPNSVDWKKVKTLLDELYQASEGLERIFPGRRFALDGHLVGSIGEVIAAYMFNVELSKASTQGHDATAPDGRRVEIKFTQGNRVAIRHQPEHLIVLRRTRGGPLEVVYNGPGCVAWNEAGKEGSNGQRPIAVSRLRKLDAKFLSGQRLRVLRSAPI